MEIYSRKQDLLTLQDIIELQAIPHLFLIFLFTYDTFSPPHQPSLCVFLFFFQTEMTVNDSYGEIDNVGVASTNELK